MSSNSKALSRLAVAIILFSFLAVDITTASTLTVSPDGSKQFTSIQKAVDNAKDNDTIVVYPGTYNENVTISYTGKLPLTALKLEGISYPVITGKFIVTGPYNYDHFDPDHLNDQVNINVRGFVFSGKCYVQECHNKNAFITIDKNKFKDSLLEIWSYSSISTNIISNNEFQNSCLFVTDHCSASIIHNTFTSCSHAIDTMYPGYVTVKDNTFSKNNYGIYAYQLTNVGGVYLIKNNIFSENDVGLLCFQEINSVNNNKFAKNKKAIVISRGKNDINSNILELNDIGIEFVHPKYSSEGQTAQSQIYNNYFNNNVNVAGNLTISKNIWSIDKTRGANIIGGPYLGGNYWGKPYKSGFSQITKDKNKDGFCDSAYKIDEANIDFLPLAGKK